MKWKVTCLSAALILAIGAWSQAQAQDGGRRGRDGDGAPFRRDDGGDGNRGGNRGFGRGGFQDRPNFWRGGPGFENFTPEQRSEFYSRMIDRQLRRYDDEYELTDEQRAQARQRLDTLRQEALATSEQRQQQVQGIREQFRQLREQREAGGNIDREQWETLGNQMREIMRNSPLMNEERVLGAIEQVIPPEQAARGRQRIQEERTREEQRREERRQQWEQRRQEWEQFRQQGGDPREFWEQQRERWQRERAEGEARSDADNDGDRGGRRGDRGRRGDFQRGGDDNDNDRRRGDRREENAAPQDDPLGSWERYVRDYGRHYRFDESQRATANSILRDLLTQRKLYEDVHRDKIAEAQRIEDAELRQKQLDFVAGPINRMYDELKTKLERIPTIAQREAAEDRRTATQPASTRPADSGGIQLPGERRGDGQRDNNNRRERGRRARGIGT